MNPKQSKLNNAELTASVQACHEVECRKKEFFFSTSATRQGIEDVGRLNQSELLPRSYHYCCFYDNSVVTLTTNFIFQFQLSTGEDKMMKKKTKVISTRVTKHFADLLEQYCRQDAYINCSDFVRNALREKLRRDAPERFKRLFEGENAA